MSKASENAVKAMKLGAYDYIIKPFDVDEVLVIVNRALEHTKLKSQNIQLKETLRARSAYNRLIGTSKEMRSVIEMIDKVANTRTTVLLSGESGTGKEVVARALHTRSNLAENQFVAINCGAIPESLIESELFGHVRGSFTGATSNKEGLFETATNGTLFLDEIGEIPLATQVKLLRVLQEKKIRRVGGSSDINVNCRIVAASNRVLEKEVAEGRFREDLFFRLNVIQIGLPALRHRKEDIPLLADAFVAKFSEEQARDITEITDKALELLVRWHWPGNIRELENVIERAVTLLGGDKNALIDASILPINIQDQQSSPPALIAAYPTEVPNKGIHIENALETYERSLLQQALQMTDGHKTQAAAKLGLSFRSFRYRIAKLGLQDYNPSGSEPHKDKM